MVELIGGYNNNEYTILERENLKGVPEVIHGILMDFEGNIFLQRRSQKKSSNPNLLDKSVGGHVRPGEKLDCAIIRECREELGVSSLVVSKRDLFQFPVETFKDMAVFYELDYIRGFESLRKVENSTKLVTQNVGLFLGYYNGRFKFNDGEAIGVEKFSLEELSSQFLEFQELFTNDLVYILERYKQFIEKF